MIEEMGALNKDDNWELIPFKHTVSCRWVYTLKKKADGSIERAHIVTKRFHTNLWHRISTNKFSKGWKG